MCGLAGVLLAPRRRSAADLRHVRRLFVQNLLANEVRGRDATGIALVRTDGEVALHKAPIPASAFVKSTEFERVLSALDNDTLLLLGHARHPTQGSPANNQNNHPLHTGHVVGIHNGHISNDDGLFARFHLPRAAEVDSEVIFRLIDRLPPTASNDDYLDALTSSVHLIDGTLAIIALDLRRPDRLVIVKRGAPLSVHYDRVTEALHLSSRYIFLRKTFGPGILALDEMLPDPSVALFRRDALVEGALLAP
ncbi:MAG: class II glutamine amidotransferase [Anaerolineales bacterium]